jgi:hypothetical protein
MTFDPSTKDSVTAITPEGTIEHRVGAAWRCTECGETEWAVRLS